MSNYGFMIIVKKSHDSNHKFQNKITLFGSNKIIFILNFEYGVKILPCFKPKMFLFEPHI